MHVSDGILPVAVWVGSYAVSVGIVGITTRVLEISEVDEVLELMWVPRERE